MWDTSSSRWLHEPLLFATAPDEVATTNRTSTTCRSTCSMISRFRDELTLFTASMAYSTWKRWPSGEKTVIARSYLREEASSILCGVRNLEPHCWCTDLRRQALSQSKSVGSRRSTRSATSTFPGHKHQWRGSAGVYKLSRSPVVCVGAECGKVDVVQVTHNLCTEDERPCSWYSSSRCHKELTTSSTIMRHRDGGGVIPYYCAAPQALSFQFRHSSPMYGESLSDEEPRG